MRVTRTVPDVGYVDKTIYDAMSISQTVRAGEFVHFSGVVAAAGAGRCVAPGDVRAQLVFILEILSRLLAKENMSFANVITVMVYTTNMALTLEHMEPMVKAFSGAPPTSTWLEVKALGVPECMVELVVTAVDSSEK
jgi:2-iminobutanoate/2-iminopropanoate deaminase